MLKPLILSFGLLVGQAAQSITIAPEDLIKLIRENNGKVKASALSVEAAEARTGHLMRSYFPNITLEAGGETFQTGAYSTRTEHFGQAEVRLNLSDPEKICWKKTYANPNLRVPRLESSSLKPHSYWRQDAFTSS